MNITIIPFNTSEAPEVNRDFIKNEPGRKGKQYSGSYTYWGIYIDDEQVSYTSSRELAEKSRLWMEKWLNERN